MMTLIPTHRMMIMTMIIELCVINYISSILSSIKGVIFC